LTHIKRNRQEKWRYRVLHILNIEYETRGNETWGGAKGYEECDAL
jgi:hypothetical protein